jgi:hypothetical protein
LINNFRKWISGYFVRKNLKGPRVPQVYNLDSANSLCFLFNADNRKEFDLIQRLIKEVKTKHGIKDVSALGITRHPRKKLPSYLAHSIKDVLIYTKNDYTVFYKPKSKGKAFLDFARKNFNILIDFTKNVLPPGTKLLAMSEAEFKVGFYKPENEPFYELMIGGQKSTMEEFTKQVFHYLNIINKNDAKKV